jgi:4-hydroxybenzoate polyprenyltransferase
MCMTVVGGALVRASHPLPTAAVTALSATLAATLRTPPPTLVTLIVAVLSGQLSVGWLNDLVDRDRDRAVGRTDKPVALGQVPVTTVRAAVAIAAVICVPTSLALGLAAGTAHLVAVAGAWAYNLGLKRTAWSWLPYAIGFGLLPVAVWLASPAVGLPPWWMASGAALLGVGAHGANVLPDLADDRATGVSGLPQRLGQRPLRIATAVVLFAAFVTLTAGPPRPLVAAEWAALGVAATLALVAGGLGRARLPDRAPFYAAIGVAALAVVMLLARGAAG